MVLANLGSYPEKSNNVIRRKVILTINSTGITPI